MFDIHESINRGRKSVCVCVCVCIYLCTFVRDSGCLHVQHNNPIMLLSDFENAQLSPQNA